MGKAVPDGYDRGRRIGVVLGVRIQVEIGYWWYCHVRTKTTKDENAWVTWVRR